MGSADLKLIERLRNENLEQFFTLVRMHLSFVVDINTDEVDCSADKPKQFRWNFHKKTKSSSSNSSQINASNTKRVEEANSITEEGILRLYELIEFLSQPDNVIQEGIFRRTGSLSRQQELRQLLATGSSLGLEDGRFSVHDCASVLKGFLAELPQPLLMDQYYQTYCTLAAQYPPNAESSEEKLLTALQLLLLLLAPSHRHFLERLLGLLRLVADHEPNNRMSPDTLATMFTPHLLCPRKLSPETFHSDSIAMSPLVSFMIRQSGRLFLAPRRLATDAAAYCAARERTTHLDDSITDRTAANTVYSFVDRHRTRAENETNPTDTALAQLYAHIQALPDSHHKRRLVKNFNRQNGYGTPIQIQRTGKVAGSRSFGDSIKRHIFTKGLRNKTPKKGSGDTANVIQEESIMTPRSRKPLIITSEQTPAQEAHALYESMSPRNDSDFVSSDDERSTFSFERSGGSGGTSQHSGAAGTPPRTEHEPTAPADEQTNTHTALRNGAVQLNTSGDVSLYQTKSLTEPFREYLRSRSVLTATPIDLSILNKSDADDHISDSLMYCLDGNIPADLTSSVGLRAVDSNIDRSLKCNVNIDVSPSGKRCVAPPRRGDRRGSTADKENVHQYELRETDL